MNKKHLAIVVSFSGNGGVEKMMINLINEFTKYENLSIDLLLIKDKSKYLQNISEKVNIIKLRSKHSSTSFIPILLYLKKNTPDAVLVAKERAGRAVILAKLLSRNNSRIVLRLGTNLARAMQGKHALARFIRYKLTRFFYRHFSAIVAVSDGVRQDTHTVSNVPLENIHVIRNPVITPQLLQQSTHTPNHPWLTRKTLPVIMGAGRLTQQKGFDTLIQAFALINKQIKSRLIILGDGDPKKELIELATTLGVQDLVDFPGFTNNPYSYLSHADLFILSSRWEGSPNALTEAMALGTQIVSTDCPSGPSELLQNGKIAPLVPVDDPATLANAAIQVLNNPIDPQKIKDAVSSYTPARAAEEYLKLLQLI